MQRLSRLSSVWPTWRLVRLLFLALAGGLALPAAAQSSFLGALGDDGFLVHAGWQRGQFANHGMGNMRYHALRFERGENTASVEKHLAWTDTYQGPTLGIVYVDDAFGLDLRWNNRHTLGGGTWTDMDGQAWDTDFRVRLNELNIGFGYRLWGGRLRPGISADIGLLRISRRDAKKGENGVWTPMHSDSDFFLSGGGKTPTAGVSAFCDLTLAVTKHVGFIVRPYYQAHLINADYLGLYGTRDVRTFRYGINNFGVSVSAALLRL